MGCEHAEEEGACLLEVRWRPECDSIALQLGKRPIHFLPNAHTYTGRSPTTRTFVAAKNRNLQKSTSRFIRAHLSIQHRRLTPLPPELLLDSLPSPHLRSVSIAITALHLLRSSFACRALPRVLSVPSCLLRCSSLALSDLSTRAAKASLKSARSHFTHP